MSSDRKANEAQFFLMIGNKDPSAFKVRRFSCIDEVSIPYDLTVEVETAEGDLKIEQILNKPASLYMFREGEYFPYSGIINEFHYAGSRLDRTFYRARLLPKLSILDLQQQTRIFQKKSLPDIIKNVLDQAGLQSYYKMQLSQTYPAQEYVLQYQESDLNFITRLMESAGIWYFFKEASVPASQVKPGGSMESLLITDKAVSFQVIPGDPQILFRDPSGLVDRDDKGARESVSEVRYQQTIVPQEVMVRNYNYRTPEVQLTGKNKVKSGIAGSVYEYGGNFKNVTEAQRAAEVAANRIASRQMLVEGQSNCGALRSGCRFTLAEHSRAELNADFVVCRIVHAGGHEADGMTYGNSFEALPADRANNFAPQKRAIYPKVNGVMTAAVEAGGSSYAALDDMGRYKVRMPFDTSSAKNSDASKYLRLMQPYAGAKYGMHFPVHEGAEMVWACIDGDPNKPIGLGSVPNANTVSPVASANKVQNIIRTAGGNEILLDDTDKKQKARITTSAKHTLEMDDDLKRISLKSTKANELLLDDKNGCVKWNGSAHSITMTYAKGSEGIVITTKEGNTIKIDDANKKITISTKGGHTVDMDDDGKKLTLADGQGKSTVTLDGQGGIVLDSKGKIQISAQQDIEIKGANIKMTANASLEAKAGANLKLKGSNIEAKADMNAKLQSGMNLELKGGAQTKLSGMMTEVGGSTMAKVKGAVVMIN